MEPVFWIDYFSIPFLFVFTLILVVGSILLAAAFSFIIVLIADLDRSTEGTIVLDQTPVIEFQKKIEALD